jgi:hypothetical protein
LLQIIPLYIVNLLIYNNFLYIVNLLIYNNFLYKNMASSVVAANPGSSASTAAAPQAPASLTTSTSASIPPIVPNTVVNGPAVISQYQSAGHLLPQGLKIFEYDAEMNVLANPKLDPKSDDVCQAHDTVISLMNQQEGYLTAVKTMCSEVKLSLLREVRRISVRMTDTATNK